MLNKIKQFSGTIVGLLIKSKSILALGKAAKAAKSAKFLVSFFSMFISAVAYGWKLGPLFGIGFVTLIFMHEMGHVLALKKYGYKASLPLFIPFLGAVIFSPPMNDREEESVNGYMGPLAGTIGILIPTVLYFLWPSQQETMILLIYLGLWINLFNMLLIIRPFDGGRVLQILGPWYKWIGLSIFVVLLFIMKSVGLLIILLFALHDFNLNAKKRMIYTALIAVIILIGETIQWVGWQSFIITFMIVLFIVITEYLFVYKTYIVTKKIIDTSSPEIKQLTDSLDQKIKDSNFDASLMITDEQMNQINMFREAKKTLLKFEANQSEDNRPYPSNAIKWKWVVYWVILTAILMIGMMVIKPYLPIL